MPAIISSTLTEAVKVFLLIVNVSSHVASSYLSVAGMVALTIYDPTAEGTEAEYASSGAALLLYSYTTPARLP